MTEITVECIPFKKGIITPEEIDLFHENIDESCELELKMKVQEIFHHGGMEINLDEIFAD